MFRLFSTLGVFLLAAGPAAGGLAAQEVCSRPIGWHVAALDERFGLSEQDASDAVRQAGVLWSTAAGNPLLFPESPEGIPIRFVFDERQEESLRLRGLRADLAERERAVADAGAQLDRLGDELDRQREVLQILRGDFDERWEAHMQTVEGWNQRGGAPPQELARLGREEDALAAERSSLESRARRLNELVTRMNEETQRVNEMIAALNRERMAFQEALPDSVGPPAEYRETRRSFGPFSVSLTREIDIYRFDDRDHLVLILARQLGYALGLETSEVPGAVMSLEPRRGAGEGPPRLDPTDEAALRELCAR
jgi:hypothetical protein